MASSVLSDQICTEFERNLSDGRNVKFQIETVPEDLRGSVVEFMLGNYIREEVWCVAAGTAKDPVAIQEYRVLLTSIVRDNLSVACFLASDDGAGRTLIGASIGMLQKKDAILDHQPPKSKPGLKTLRMFMEAMKVTAIYDKYKVNEYLIGAGISVSPEYRRLGIGVELLKARIKKAKQLSIPVVGGIFTGASSQRSAQLAGFECCYEISYKKFGNQCRVRFDTTTPTLRIMALSVN